MGKRTLLFLPAVVVALLLSGMPADGQKARPKKKPAAPTVVVDPEISADDVA